MNEINKKEYSKKYRELNKEKLKEYDKKNYEKNKEKYKENNKLYRENNKEKILLKEKLYRENNKEKYRERKNKYQKEKRVTNLLFKLKGNILSRINVSFKKNGYNKKSKTYEILGCSYEEFKNHLERQFTKGMNWDNQGQWHLDHIYPISLAKDEHDLIKLNHYTNFQPLWAFENLSKGKKILHNTQIKLI
jgi:hypothetical protein